MIDIAGDKMIFEKQFWKELFSEFSNDDVTGLARSIILFFLAIVISITDFFAYTRFIFTGYSRDHF